MKLHLSTALLAGGENKEVKHAPLDLAVHALDINVDFSNIFFLKSNFDVFCFKRKKHLILAMISIRTIDNSK